MIKFNKPLLSFIILIVVVYASLVIEFHNNQTENFYPARFSWYPSWWDRWWKQPWFYRSDFPSTFLSKCPAGCVYSGYSSNRPSGFRCEDYGECPGPGYGCCRYDYECGNC